MKQTKELKRVLIMAGGTGGHVFPGLAVAKLLRDNGVDVQWLGTDKGIEARLVPEASIPIHYIKVGGVRGKNLKTLLKAPLTIASAVWQARRVIRDFKPQVVLGMGGYASGPGGLASWLTRTPLVIHEQNAKPGLTNKVLGQFAQQVLQAFPASFPSLRDVQTIGNPVRDEIESLPAPETRNQQNHPRLKLLVIGGSLGAKALNDVVPKALARMPADERPEVIHQAGPKQIDDAKNNYESIGLDAKVEPFIEDMAGTYAWADIVLCRAGALTVAELCAAGVGAIFIPYPHAVDDHQTANAKHMVDAGAALCIQQQDLTAEKLTEILRDLTQAPAKRAAMAVAAYQLRQSNVQKVIVDTLKEVAKGEQH